MHTKRSKQKRRRIQIVTLGCSKNLVDSEVMAAQLDANRYDVSHDDSGEPHIVIVNTCGFIDPAKHQSLDTIEGFLEAKRRGALEQVFITGCLAQRYRNELAEDYPDVDGIFGVTELPKVLQALGGTYRENLVGERQLGTPSHFAYLKISEGCNRRCSFCVIPQIRGDHQSRPMAEIISEAKGLLGQGTKELIMIAQDLTYYGKDTTGERQLPELVQRLSDLDGLQWLRLLYTHPASFPTEILPIIRERPNICRYLDLPVQHISTRMLKLMRRGIDKEKTEDLIRQIRDEVPGIAIRSTLLTGHPGETEEDHAQAMDFLKEFRLDRVGVFTYSPEEDTHSLTLSDSEVPEDIAQARFDDLMQLQQTISGELNQTRIGQILPVLIDRQVDGQYYGRTEADAPDVDNEVIVSGDNIEIGNFYDVKITDATDYDIAGTVHTP